MLSSERKLIGKLEVLRELIEPSLQTTGEPDRLATVVEELEVALEELIERSKRMDAAWVAADAERLRYAELFHLDPRAQVITTIAGLITDSNRTGRSMLGVFRGSVASLFRPRSVGTFERVLDSLRADPRPHRVEAELTTPDGRVVRASVVATREEGEQGPRIRWTFEEPASRRAARNRRSVPRVETDHGDEQAKALYNHSETLITAIGHDLRNPLHASIGLVEMLIDQHGRIDDRLRLSMLARIKAETEAVGRMLDALLARARRGLYGTGATETVDIVALSRTLVDRLDPPHHDLEVTGSSVTVQVDPFLAERILDNLVSNALEHTPPGTKISISAIPSDEGIVVRVEDEGPGRADDLTRWMTASPRLDREDRASRGVGLSLVTRFTALLGGRFWVEDRPGGGIAACVLIP